MTKDGYAEVINVSKAGDTGVYNLCLDNSEDGFLGDKIAVGDFIKQQSLF